jgi:class 3 adenylate cyclase
VLVFEGDDYIGRTVNLAARLCDEARPGELLVATAEEHRVATSLPLQPRDPIAIRGFRVPVSVRSIGSTSAGSLGRPPRAV